MFNTTTTAGNTIKYYYSIPAVFVATALAKKLRVTTIAGVRLLQLFIKVIYLFIKIEVWVLLL